MIDGLIISEEKNLFDEINLNIDSDISYFEYADSLAMAKKRIELDSFDYVILIEKDAEKMVRMMTDLKKIDGFRDAPVVCFSAEMRPEDRLKLWQMGVKDMFELPVLREELKLRLETFFKDISQFDTDEQIFGMQGKLEDYNLLDIVQTMEQNKKTGILTLYHGRDEGKIWFFKGRICEALFNKFNNVDAIYKMASWLEGDFTISFSEDEYERKIESENRQILLDVLAYIDKRDKLLEILPDVHETLLISPETDMNMIDEADMSLLRFFQGGQTIIGYLSTFDMDELFLLEKMGFFIDNQLLMTRAQFDSHVTEQEKNIADAGIKKVFKKIFKGKQVIPRNGKTESSDEQEETYSDQSHSGPAMITQKINAAFDINKIKIDEIKSVVESL